MPVVEVKWWEGRTREQKAKIIEGISKVFKDVVGTDVEVLIIDIPKDNWGSSGKQSSGVT